MNRQSTDTLRDLLLAHGLACAIEGYHPADNVLRAMIDLLARVSDEFQRRAGRNFSFEPQQLEKEAKRNPHKIHAFLQALSISNSAEMLVMVWRILQGQSIRELKVEYREREGFVMDVALSSPAEENGALEYYRSTDINDAALIRHFGIATIRGEPLFEGFYPLRAKE